MTISDCCKSLEMIKKILVVLGVVDMRQLLLNECAKKWVTIAAGTLLCCIYFNMVILSCRAKKNQNLNVRKKSSVYY